MLYRIQYPTPINAVIGDCIAFKNGVHKSDLTQVLRSFAESPEEAIARLKAMGCTVEVVDVIVEPKKARKSAEKSGDEGSGLPPEGGE